MHGLCILILLLRETQCFRNFGQICSKKYLLARYVFVSCFEWLSADLPLMFHRGYLLEKYDNSVLAGPWKCSRRDPTLLHPRRRQTLYPWEHCRSHYPLSWADQVHSFSLCMNCLWILTVGFLYFLIFFPGQDHPHAKHHCHTLCILNIELM